MQIWSLLVGNFFEEWQTLCVYTESSKTGNVQKHDQSQGKRETKGAIVLSRDEDAQST